MILIKFCLRVASKDLNKRIGYYLFINASLWIISKTFDSTYLSNCMLWVETQKIEVLVPPSNGQFLR